MTDLASFLINLLADRHPKLHHRIGPGVKRSRELQPNGRAKATLLAGHKGGTRNQSRFLAVAEKRLRRYGNNNRNRSQHAHPPGHLAEKMALLIVAEGAKA